MDQKGAYDVRVAAVAARQHGAVSIAQLRECGVSDTAVRDRLRAGRLHRLHRGVYAVGHLAPSIERQWMAAVLALEGDAVLSHRSAAGLWRLLPVAKGPVDIALPGQGGRKRRKDIRIHRCQSLQHSHMTRHRGIPVTTPARTVADLRSVASAPEHRRAVRQAAVLGLRIGPDVAPDRTRSELEFEFLRLCKRYRLQMPQVNVPIGPLLVDFLWESQRYVVETDGYRYHRGQAAFEDDHSRDLELRTRGYEVARLSYRQVVDEPAKVAHDIRRALKRRA
jgi:very-short-patch-repair endonuclease